MTDGSGESRQSVGPGLPPDADYSLFARVAPALPLPQRAIFANPDAVAAVAAMLAAPRRSSSPERRSASTAARTCRPPSGRTVAARM